MGSTTSPRGVYFIIFQENTAPEGKYLENDCIVKMNEVRRLQSNAFPSPLGLWGSESTHVGISSPLQKVPYHPLALHLSDSLLNLSRLRSQLRVFRFSFAFYCPAVLFVLFHLSINRWWSSNDKVKCNIWSSLGNPHLPLSPTYRFLGMPHYTKAGRESYYLWPFIQSSSNQWDWFTR